MPRNLVGDVNRIKQIIINLVGNAIKFTETGGVNVKIFAHTKGDLVDLKIEVSDTGIGIPSSKQTQIFDRFYQINQHRNRQYQGSGLGLVIVKSLVELMGGDISLRSTPKEGSTFLFNLKLKKAKEDIQEAILEENYDFSGITVLIAEDNEINQMLLAKQLKSFGLDADIATNGDEVLSMMKKKNYDLIFMDVQMPNLDGIETTEIIRSRQDLNRPLIIALTANAMKDDKDKCIAAGMNDYLSKPVTIKDLKKVMVQWFG